MSTWIALRTDRFGTQERLRLEALSRVGLPLAVVADERSGAVDTGPFPKVALAPESVARLGLPLHPDMGWLCGDYFAALFAEAFPDAQYVWLIEPDMRFHFKDPRTFFAAFSGSPADLISVRFDLAPSDWYWTPRMAPFGTPVRRMLFGGIRLSRRAIAAVASARRLLPPGLRANSCPNDEAFVATILGNGAFECRSYADFGHFWTSATFSFSRPISGRLFDAKEPDELVYHPVLYGEGFLRKARAFVRRYPSAEHVDDMHEGILRELGPAAAAAFRDEYRSNLQLGGR